MSKPRWLILLGVLLAVVCIWVIANWPLKTKAPPPLNLKRIENIEDHIGSSPYRGRLPEDETLMAPASGK